MPKYILQELPEEMTDGKKIVFPKMQTYTLHDYETVIQHMCAGLLVKDGYQMPFENPSPLLASPSPSRSVMYT